MAAPEVQSLKRYFDQLTTGAAGWAAQRQLRELREEGRPERSRYSRSSWPRAPSTASARTARHFCTPTWCASSAARGDPGCQALAGGGQGVRAQVRWPSFRLSNAELQQLACSSRAAPARRRVPSYRAPARAVGRRPARLRVGALRAERTGGGRVLRRAARPAERRHPAGAGGREPVAGCTSPPSCSRAREVGAAVRPFAVLMLNPLLLEPQYHKQVLLPASSSPLPPPCCTVVRWWSLLPAALLQQMAAVCQQFITGDFTTRTDRRRGRRGAPSAPAACPSNQNHRPTVRARAPPRPPSTTPRRLTRARRAPLHGERAREGRRPPRADDGLDYRVSTTTRSTRR